MTKTILKINQYKITSSFKLILKERIMASKQKLPITKKKQLNRQQ